MKTEVESNAARNAQQSPARTKRRESLRFRLPLTVTALVAVVLGLFLLVIYREFARAAVQSGSQRALTTAIQIGETLSSNSSRGLSDLHRVAQAPILLDYFRNPTPDSRDRLQQALKPLAIAAQPPVVLLNAAGQQILVVANTTAPPSPASDFPLPEGRPAVIGISELQRHGDAVFSDVSIEVREQSTGDDSTLMPGRLLGFLVLRRIVQNGPNAELLNRLIGAGAHVAFGNRKGNLWTDLTTPIPSPPIDATRTAITTVANEANASIGGVSLIEGTPWAVWIEFPRSVVMAPVRVMVARLALLALGFIVVSAVVVVVMSRRVTRPLNELTEAAEAIAAGRTHHPVSEQRGDEIGRMTVAFNAMTEHVAEARRVLEGAVEQRTVRLEERTAELDHLFTLSPDLLCIADVAGRFLRVSASWQDTLGWTEEELTTVPYVNFVHPDDRAATNSETATLADGKVTYSFDNRYRTKDGSYRILSWRAAPLASSGLIFAIARDVTEARRTARQLEDRNLELTSVNQELEAFTYSVSHDLRAPLRHITGFASLLEQSAVEKLDDTEKRRLRQVNEAATRLGRLIDDLLAFSRMNKTTVTARRVRLDEVVREAKQELMHDPDVQRVRWTVHALPEVEGEATMLKQVLVNLMSNAAKYSRPTVDPAVEIGSQELRSGEIVLFVRDNGVGFDMKYADKLFGVFQRLHRAEEFEGTGIGLATVRRIIQRHGGRTWAEGVVGSGATFYCSLPAPQGALIA